MNLSTAADEWSPAGATWYGSPDGAGSDGTTIAFRVDPGSNPYYFAVAPQFEEGDGDLATRIRVGITSSVFNPVDSGNTGRILVANDVIPAGWQPGAIYPSLVNYL
ncbi:hypothetical protein C3L33_03064, partial [Rhododendron williamsianum]